MLNRISLFSLLFVFVGFQSTSTVSATNTFIMAFSQDPATSPQYSFYLKVYSEVFTELGYAFEYELYPSLRASHKADLGEVDGEPQRIFDYANRNPNQIRVEEPIFENRTLAFSTDPTIKIETIDSLNGTDFRVDYLRGSVWSKQYLEPRILPKNLKAVDGSHQGFMKLINNRSDIFIVLEVVGRRALEHHTLTDSGVIILGEVGSNLSYPYLHKSHADLVPKLEQALRNIKKSGRYNELLFESMPFLDNR
ncbi:transporter substrate-binding domain-containing protein [Vibrio sp. ZSDE26]|uniref:Transporter substrate-binding domain-containing protein n=1 Tax=Vibrio amylolyticus TaxID=2847292 RepID=A0A9X1XI17_9VIBR|nr:transporter substrate-binding domain-containing protein [Vibrio amylolyticus]MCK6262018.1 transporter substrate-binding domain-containing protein [Vibrio amylolyticus]